MRKEKNIALLNALIEINNDRIEGYKSAFNETNELDLKDLFKELIETSQTCKLQLVEEVFIMGGVPLKGITVEGKFFRVWMDLKVALGGNNRKAILNSCKYGEDTAVNRYKQALRNNLHNITAEQQNMLNDHYALILADRNKILALREPILELR